MTGREKLIPQAGGPDPLQPVADKLDRILNLLQGELGAPEKGLVAQVRDLQNGRADHEGRLLEAEENDRRFDKLREERNVEMIDIKSRVRRLEEAKSSSNGLVRALGLTAAGGVLGQMIGAIAALVQSGMRPPHPP